MAQTALEKIQAIKEKADKEIELLKREAVSELARRLSEAKAVVRELEKEYESLTGKTTRGEKVHSDKAPKANFADEKELKALLSNSPTKRLNRKGINDAGYSLKSALIVARANSKTFGFEQNGPQGEVWLK